MNGEIDIVTRRTLKPDWQVNAEKDKNGGAKLEAGNLSNQDPLEAERVALLAITKKLVTAWQQERDALQRAQEIKDNAYTNSIGYAITEAAALAAGKRDLTAGTTDFTVDKDYENRFFQTCVKIEFAPYRKRFILRLFLFTGRSGIALWYDQRHGH